MSTALLSGLFRALRCARMVPKRHGAPVKGCCGGYVECPNMGEGREQANSGGRTPDRVTIGQAAAMLGVHPNTIRNHVKAGVYDAEKVVTENGQTWMIEGNILLNNPLPKGPQQTPLQRQPGTGV